MVRIEFAKAFRRHVDCPPADVAVDVESGADGAPMATVRAALDGYFARFPATRSYVLDDVGAVRKHVTIFVGSDLIADRARQSDTVSDGATIHVFQALSGG